MPKKKSTKIYKLWSPSIIGSIYFDNDGNWWVYRESQKKLIGISKGVKGKVADVVPKSFEYKYNQLKAVI